MGSRFKISRSLVNPSTPLRRDLAPESGLPNEPNVTQPEVIKANRLLKGSELIKNWRRRFLVLLQDGSFLGFKAQPKRNRYSSACNHFSVDGCHVMTKDETRRSSLIVCGPRAGGVERVFSANSVTERTGSVEAIQRADQGLLRVNEETVGGQALEYGTIKSSSDLPSKITMDDFQLIQVLGKGSFAEVVMCRDKFTNQILAMKILKRGMDAADEKALKHMLTECRVLQTTRHPFLATLRYSFRCDDRLCFAMEYASGGELFFHLSAAEVFSEERSRFYGAEITLALQYLHQQGIIHRDLKLENVLLAADGHIKLADFGLCKENMFYGDTTETFCGTPEYVAPEMLEEIPYGRAVDWWALGVIMYQMLCGDFPFYSSDRESLYDMIMDDDVEPPPALSFKAQSLLKGLLAKDPGVRLGGGESGADEVKRHEFFAGVQWDRLLAKKITPPFVPEISSATDTRYFDSGITEQRIALTTRNSYGEALK